MPSQLADRVVITTVVDNYADFLLANSERVRRAAPGTAVGAENKRLVAEHGLSLLVEVSGAAGGLSLLLDAGFGEETALRNLRALGADMARVEKIILSHGHVDHFGGLAAVLHRYPRPVILHPHAFFRRENRLDDGRALRMPTLAAEELRKAGAQLVVTAEPVALAPGATTTGEVPRLTDFETAPRRAFRADGDAWVPDEIRDDQALVVNLRGKGLVVISGCAHAGIVNTVRQAQRLTGVEQVHALAGGFHLSGAPEEVVDLTIAEILALEPAVVMPMHCTGWRVVHRFAEVFGDGFVLNAVGTSVTLG